MTDQPRDLTAYTMTTPCSECPFLKANREFFSLQRLREFADHGTFPCHKSAELQDDVGYVAEDGSVACAGALIFNEKHNRPNQMMRVCERIGMYDRSKLNMKAKVR